MWFLIAAVVGDLFAEHHFVLGAAALAGVVCASLAGYRGASGKLDLGDDGEVALGSSATFWRVKGDAVVEEAAGVCASSNL